MEKRRNIKREIKAIRRRTKMNEEYLKEYLNFLRNSTLIYQNGITIKKIIYML